MTAGRSWRVDSWSRTSALHSTSTTTLGAEGDLMAFDEFNELIGVEAKYKLAERYGVRG